MLELTRRVTTAFRTYRRTQTDTTLTRLKSDLVSACGTSTRLSSLFISYAICERFCEMQKWKKLDQFVGIEVEKYSRGRVPPILDFFRLVAMVNFPGSIRSRRSIGGGIGDGGGGGGVSSRRGVGSSGVRSFEDLKRSLSLQSFADMSNIQHVAFAYCHYELRLMLGCLRLESEGKPDEALAEVEVLVRDLVTDCRKCREARARRKAMRSSTRGTGTGGATGGDSASSAGDIYEVIPSHALGIAQMRCLFHSVRIAVALGKVKRAVDQVRWLLGTGVLRPRARIEAYRQLAMFVLAFPNEATSSSPSSIDPGSGGSASGSASGPASVPGVGAGVGGVADPGSAAGPAGTGAGPVAVSVSVSQTEDLYQCQNSVEEAMLSLLLAESRLPQGRARDDCDVRLLNDIVVCVTESRCGRMTPVPGIFRRRLGRAFPDERIWRKVGFALMVRKEYADALSVFKECWVLSPKSAQYPMMIAKLRLLLEGLPGSDFRSIMKWTDRALERNPGFFKPQILMLQAAALSRRVAFVHKLTEKQALQKRLLSLLESVVELNPTNRKACYNLALQYAFVRDIPKAFQFAKRGLSLDPGCLQVWLLVALLFTIDQIEYARDTLEKAARRFSGSLQIPTLLIRLMEGELSPALLDRVTKAIYLSMNGGLSGVDAPLQAVRRSSPGFEDGLKLLFLVVETCVENYLFPQATAILRDLSTCHGIDMHPEYNFYLGYVSISCPDDQRESLWASLDPVESLERVLVKNPNHKRALAQLGIYYASQNQNALAASYLQSATRVDSTMEHAWFNLGQVYQNMNEFQKASECFFTAVKLEKTSPVIPFDALLDVMI